MALTHPSWTVDTTFSGKDISTAASVYAFTAGAAAKVQFVVKATVAGNGDYIVYLTHQWLGAGTAAVVLPKTTAAAASGETVIEFVSLEIAVKATDVVNVMIDGLAGDTNVSGAIRISADNPSVFDAANDVPAVNVTYSADVALTGRLAQVTDLPAAAPSAATVADAVWDEAIAGHVDAGSTGKALADTLEDTSTTLPAAITAATGGLASQASVSALPNAAAMADAVWDEALAGHAAAGSTGAALSAAGTAGDPWAAELPGSYDSGTAGSIIGALASIDTTAVTQVAASSAGHLTITAALTFDEAVTGLTIPADWVAAIWTLKADASKPDTAALVQLRETSPAALTDGLVRLNGAAVASPLTVASGALLVTQASGRIDIYLTDEATALLDDATDLGWDVKFIDATGDSTGYSGTADVVLTETKATT